MVQEVFEPSLYESAKESQSTSYSNAKTGRGFQSGVKFFNNGVQVDEIGILSAAVAAAQAHMFQVR